MVSAPTDPHPPTDIKQLLRDEDAASTVIGVILMVAVTVILASVIGTFVPGLGDQVSSSAPQAGFTFDFNDAESGNPDRLNATHDGGDSIAAGQLSISSSGTILIVASAGDFSGTRNTGTSVELDTAGFSGDVSSGTTIYMAPAGIDPSKDLNAETIRVTWQASSDDSTATLAKWVGPDA